MKKVTIFTIFLVFVLGVSLSFAFGIPKVGKGKLKKADKTLTLKDIDPKLEKFVGTDADPYKDKPFTFKVYGDPDIDTFIISSNKLSMTSTFGKVMMKDLNAKLDAAKTKDEVSKLEEDAKVLQAIFTSAATEGPKLVTSGTGLVTKVPGKFKSNPKDALLLPKVLTSLKDALAALKISLTDMKGLSAETVKFIGAAAEKAKTLK